MPGRWGWPDGSGWRVLLLEDNPGDARLFREMLRAPQPPQPEVTHVRDLETGRRVVGDERFDVVLLDLGLPDSQGVATLEALLPVAGGAPVVVLTGLDDQDVGAEAMRRGAQDYLVKGQVEPDLLVRTLRYAIERHDALVRATEASARAAAAEAHLRATEESRARLEHEVDERRRTQARLEQSLLQLRSLRAVDLAITTRHDRTASMAVLLAEARATLDIAAGVAWRLDTERETLSLLAQDGFQRAPAPGAHFPLAGAAATAARESRPVPVDGSSLREALAQRAEGLKPLDFASYVALPMASNGVVRGVLELFGEAGDAGPGKWPGFAEALATQGAIALDNAELYHDLQRRNEELTSAYDHTIAGWAKALDLKDEETAGHSQRVTELSVRLSRRQGLDEAAIVHVRRGALLHDIGKMGVPDSVLLKPGKLTEAEFEVIKRHPTAAYEMLKEIPFLLPALDIPYAHHEKWDGSGYPRGLAGEDIPLPARIFAVVDVFDALTSERPYRAAWETAAALDYVREQAGRHFDPDVASAFLEMLGDAAGGIVPGG
ncbi:MAG TPA: HD domain-containing phosphohydrolase [Trueperaceae bacterium]|nr:HD domain-containing phosphohydrolase [Trueperaceae bacterium]